MPKNEHQGYVSKHKQINETSVSFG